jgi:tryptophanyl-tRNA synthetase
MSTDSFEASLKRSEEIRSDLDTHPEKYLMLTGDRPTGRLHLGHYFGTIKERVALQNKGIATNIIIADYQVITDRDTTEHIQDNVYNMVIDYLACGIDPEKTMIFTHSAVPALNQLMLPFLSLVTEAELLRNPTVKAEMEASGLLRGYCLRILCIKPVTSCSARGTSCQSAKINCLILR